MEIIKERDYYDGLFRGIQLIKALIKELKEDGKEDMIPKMMDDTELTSLLLQKYDPSFFCLKKKKEERDCYLIQSHTII